MACAAPFTEVFQIVANVGVAFTIRRSFEYIHLSNISVNFGDILYFSPDNEDKTFNLLYNLLTNKILPILNEAIKCNPNTSSRSNRLNGMKFTRIIKHWCKSVSILIV